ncbi:GerAB/ArcD/ProY family transporter [Bacillus sp. 2205SS5-2]|uniref:GerAB/ArcD/ProY family transporter n=1 Tax=Bacillus sp. 2205SS5-2 TaxID=3109031 RepID=UPI0030053917
MKEKIHPIQVAILIYMIQSGVTLFSIPRLTAEAFGTNGWVGLLPIMLIVNLNILLIGLVYRWGKGKSIFILFRNVLPSWVLFPFYLLIAVNFTLLATLVLKKYILLLKMMFFQETPSFVLILMFFILSYMLLTSSIYQIGKVTVVLFFMTVWTIFLLALHLADFSFVRMTPFLFKGEIDLVSGGMNVYSAFLGFELSLFLFPYVQKKRFVKSIFIGNFITSMIYLGVSFICFGFFSHKNILMDLYPVITLLEYVKFPFIERMENMIFVLFALKVLITIVMYIWAAKELIEQSVPRLKPNFIIVCLLLLGFIVSTFPSILRDVDEWLKWLTYIDFGIAIILPFLLLLAIGVDNLKKRQVES